MLFTQFFMEDIHQATCEGGDKDSETEAKAHTCWLQKSENKGWDSKCLKNQEGKIKEKKTTVGEILRTAYKLHQKSELISGYARGGVWELFVCNIRSSPGGI